LYSATASLASSALSKVTVADPRNYPNSLRSNRHTFSSPIFWKSFLRSSLVTCFSSRFLTLSLTSDGLSILVLIDCGLSPPPILIVLCLLGAARAAFLELGLANPPLFYRPPLLSKFLGLLPMSFGLETSLNLGLLFLSFYFIKV